MLETVRESHPSVSLPVCIYIYIFQLFGTDTVLFGTIPLNLRAFAFEKMCFTAWDYTFFFFQVLCGKGIFCLQLMANISMLKGCLHSSGSWILLKSMVRNYFISRSLLDLITICFSVSLPLYTYIWLFIWFMILMGYSWQIYSYLNLFFDSIIYVWPPTTRTT